MPPSLRSCPPPTKVREGQSQSVVKPIMQCRLRGLSLPATYTEKDEFDCVRTFSCLLCPEALNTVKELEEHVVEKIVFDGSSFPP